MTGVGDEQIAIRGEGDSIGLLQNRGRGHAPVADECAAACERREAAVGGDAIDDPVIARPDHAMRIGCDERRQINTERKRGDDFRRLVDFAQRSAVDARDEQIAAVVETDAARRRELRVFGGEIVAGAITRIAATCVCVDVVRLRIDATHFPIPDLGDENVSRRIDGDAERIVQFRIHSECAVAGVAARSISGAGDDVDRIRREVDAANAISVGRRFGHVEKAATDGEAGWRFQVSEHGRDHAALRVDAANASVFRVGNEEIVRGVERDSFRQIQHRVHGLTAVAAEAGRAVAGDRFHFAVRIDATHAPHSFDEVNGAGRIDRDSARRRNRNRRRRLTVVASAAGDGGDRLRVKRHRGHQNEHRSD